jgi:RNA polymerase-binding transcription factor DksA
MIEEVTVDLEDVKRTLEDRLAQLDARVSKIEKDLRKPGSKDWTERATERENEEVLDQLNATERGEIEAIQAALERLREGRYTTCSKCGESIVLRRLEALPYTSLCVSCAS